MSLTPVFKQRLLLFLILLTTGISVTVVCLFILYRSHIVTWEERIAKEAEMWAHFIQTVGKLDKQNRRDFAGGYEAATLIQVKDAVANLYKSRTQDEFLMAVRKHDTIHYILRKSNLEPDETLPEDVPFQSQLDEPMRLALKGQTGIITGLDYKGREVLAAYRPIPILGTALVIKIDKDVLNRPFVQAALLAGLTDIMVVTVCTFIFFRLTKPMLKQLQTSNEILQREIKNRQELEEKLLASKKTLQTILDSLPVRVFWKDLDLNYLGCNKSFAEDFDYGDPKALIGKDDFAMKWKESAESFRKGDREVITTGESRLYFEETLTLPDGTKQLLRTSKVPLLDTEGHICGVIGVFEDITDEKIAKDSLKVSEERMDQVFQSTNSWVWEVDQNGLYTYSNDIVKVLLGYDPEELVGKKYFYDLFPVEQKEMIKSAAFEIFSKKGSFTDFINEVRHKKGHKVILSTNGVPNIDEAGNLTGYRGVDIDITERQRMINDLRESEEKYRLIFEGDSDAFFLLNKHSKQILDVNRAAIELFGYSRKEFLNLKMTDISAEPEKSKKAIDGMAPGKFINVHERLYKTKDGDTFPVEISAGCFLLRGEEIVFGALRDITERKETEDQMFTLGRVIEQASVSILITDSFGKIEYVNPHFCKHTGYFFKECLGKNPSLLKSGEHPQKFYKNLWNTILAGKTWQGEIKNKKKNGELYWEEAIISPVKVEDKITHFVGIKKDITREKETAEKMERMQLQLMSAEKLAAIGQLSAGVSHEVLNPVNIISVHTQLLQRKRRDDADLQEFCQKIRNEIERINKIMSGLLTFSRKGNSVKELIAIREVLDGALGLVDSDFALDNINIERRYSPDDLKITVDKDEFRQVFLNLIHNARHAMPNGGTLSVGTEYILRDNSEWMRVFISDTGTGIKPEHMEKLFLPFFTTKPEGKGTGMGLAMVHGIVKEHGGTISVESAEDKGTIFIIDLPLN